MTANDTQQQLSACDASPPITTDIVVSLEGSICAAMLAGALDGKREAPIQLPCISSTTMVEILRRCGVTTVVCPPIEGVPRLILRW
jgi:hypothetical protein